MPSHADGPDRCRHCDDRIDAEQWHPLAIGTDEAGVPQLFEFCSTECKIEWKAAE